jgi:lysophospholipase L1-like esterase
MTEKRLMSGLDSSPLAKLALGLAVFGLIVGGWMLATRYREATVTLPDDGDRQGGCTLWFVGSSSVHRWTSLNRDMAPWIAHNRGINSATYADILPRFAHIDPAQGRPRAIILYAGENDIATGVPVRTVIRQLAAFLDLRRQKFGDLPVLILSMKPSPGRAANLPDQRLFNAAAQRLIPHMPASFYADITTPLIKNGQLGDNYQPDGVHMNAQGYRIWADVVRRRLTQILPADTLRACT